MKTKPQETHIEILRRAMLFSMTQRAWQNRCQADQTKITADCDKSKLNTTKKLVVSENLQLIYQHLNQVYNWCLQRSMQSSVRKGVYFVKRDMVEEFESYLSDSNRTLNDVLVPQFLAEYDAAKENAKKPAAEGGLGDLYDEADYPTKADLAQRFSVEWCWMALSVPNELPEEVRMREIAKLEKSFADAQEDVKFALREGFKKLVDNAADLLTGKKNGKDRIFGTKSVETFNKFFDTFNARNMMNDGELEGLVDRARRVIKGINLKDLKNNISGTRDNIADAFNVVSKQMDAMLQDKPKRKFHFED